MRHAARRSDLHEHVPALMAAMRRLLRPLVRLAMRGGITFPALSDLVKGLYIDLAEAEGADRDGAATDSRVSMLTGVHRKYVKRLREEASARSATFSMPRGLSMGARIAALWNSLPEYLDEDGVPRPLPRQPASPGEPSFDGLVASLSKDIRARVVLDEFLRLGVASIDEQGRVHLLHAAFVPAAGIDERAYYLGRNVHDHLAAITHNLEGAGRPLPERCVHYENLSQEACEGLLVLAEKNGMKALRAVNERVQAGGATALPGEPQWQMNFGMYFYMAPAEATSPPPAADAPEAGDA